MKSLALLPLAAACFTVSVAAPAAAQDPSPPAQSSPQQPAPAQPQPGDQQPSGALAHVLNEASQPLPPPGAQPFLASVSVDHVSLAGSLSIQNGRAFIGNNGALTAGDRTAHVLLTRGGDLDVCASTRIHLSTDTTVSGGGLMIAIDRGALEAHYQPGQYSDVVLTPDLRILVSAPGEADLSLRVNNQGDTCVDNHGDHAPYVVVSSLMEGGAYRVQPNQRVLFERGGLEQVVDNEKESCGCPPPEPIPTPTTIVGVGAPGGTLRSESQPTPPPPTHDSTAAQNPFPLAESEGLKPPPPPPSTPVVPPGQAHAEITAPLIYNGEAAANPAASAAATPPSGSAGRPSGSACGDPLYPGLVCDSGAAAKPAPAGQKTAPPRTSPGQQKKRSRFARFLHRIFHRRQE